MTRVAKKLRLPSGNPFVPLIVAFLLVAAMLPLSPAPRAKAAGVLDWVDARGPGNGDAMALAADNVHGIIYRATVGSAGYTAFGKGVWKYQAGKWSSLGGEVASLGVWTLAYDSTGDRLYAGTYGYGVWCYNPSDGTWAEIGYDMRAYDVTALAFGGGKLYAGLWERSNYAGKGVWCYDPADPAAGFVDTGGGVKDYRILSLAWGGDRLYAGAEDRATYSYKGVWYYDPASPDADKWTDTGGGMTNGRAVALAWDYDSELLYSACGYTGASYYDPDSPDADKWTRTQSTVWPFFSCEVTALAYGEGKVYAGCLDVGFGISGVWSYDRAADQWTDTGGGMSAYETKSLAFDTVHHRLFAGTAQDGVWYYDLGNAPPTWCDTRGGVSTSYVNCLAYDPADRLLYVGTQTEGVWSYDPATGAWTDISGGVGAYETICLAWGGGKLYASCADHLVSPLAYSLWSYDPASPGPDKWTDISGTVGTVNNLVYDEARDRLYAGTGEYYSDSGGQGVWSYDPSTGVWADLSGDDIGSFKIDSLALGGDRLYAGCFDASTWWVGVWQCDLTDPSGGWTNTGGSMSAYKAYALAWDGDADRLYASRVDPNQSLYNAGDGVWVYDPTIPAPDKWTDTGGNLSNSIVYALAWDGDADRLYASCWYSFLGTFDGVWVYDPGAGAWDDTHGGVERYYVSSLVYDDELHRLYAGTGGEGVWYYGAPPAIDEVEPASGGVGFEVTVHGSFFGPGDTGAEYVTVGGVPAVVKPGSWTDTSLVCYVPAGVSGTAPVVVHNLNGASNPVGFQVIPSFTVTASVSGKGGKVSPPTQKVVEGGTASIDLIPDSGYHAETITDNGEAKQVADPFVIENVQSDHAVVVTFAPDAPPPPPPPPTTNSIFYFAEGTCRPAFDPYLCIQNPGEKTAEVRITYMLGNGTTSEHTLSVSPHSRATVPVKAHLGEGDDEAHDFSAKVETTN
ncbi:MAG: IPT/TIG domain-containing protein, partial [Actinobacteria bacterium]|nr:IPT/TIG domain-containing protein [Actinomycetota bacterium]